MMNQLVEFFEQCLRDMKKMESPKGKLVFFDQAFGSVRFVQMVIDDDTELIALWEEWAEKFKAEIWE